MRILFVAAEVAPFAKVGGLADVAGALPKVLTARGHDIRVIMPRYASIDGERYGIQPELGGATFAVPGSSEEGRLHRAEIGEVPVYFVANDRYFGRDNVYGYEDDVERFLYFCRAALSAVDAVGWSPDVVHVNDWHTAVIPHWMRSGYTLPWAVAGAASVITIHNLAYQGGFDPSRYPREWINPEALSGATNGSHNLLADGIAGADLVTTVSERYAEEITQPDYGEGLDELLRRRGNELKGIINGIDYEVFDPARDPAIARAYSADDISGKQECKAALQREAGFDVSARTPLIGIVGRLADQKGFDLVANIAEPFLRYGTVPIVRSTGGLADTVTDYQPATGRGTGFVFREYDAVALSLTLGR